MRVIGRIEPNVNRDEQYIENGEYVRGAIVELTPHEMALIKALQDACEGRQWRTGNIMEYWQEKAKDIDMSEAFAVIEKFVIARFAINDFKNMVTELENTVTRLDKASEL